MKLIEILLRWLYRVVNSESPGRTICWTFLGAFTGGVLGIVVPLGLGIIDTWGDDDPTAGSGYGMFMLFTLPLGLYIGGYIGAHLSSPRD